MGAAAIDGDALPALGGSRSGGVQVIARAMAVLRSLEGESDGLSLGEIARRVALPRSTVQRIVRALAHEQVVMSTPQGAHVRLGPALIRLAAGARLDIVDLARPYLEQLSQTLDETVDLSIVVGTEAVFVDHVIAARRLRLISDIGRRFPLHCTANGKAMLADMKDEDVRVLLQGNLKAFTRNTITRWPDFMRELKEIRRRGIAFDREEHSEAICAVGAALRDANGHLVSISVPVPLTRFIDAEQRIAAEVQKVQQSLLAATRVPSHISTATATGRKERS